MKRKICLLLACVLLFLSCGLAGCDDAQSGQSGQSGQEAGETRTVTDMFGREVTLPKNIERVVCIGSGALRLYSYIGDMSKLCGVEECEYGYLISVRPYQMVNEELFKSLPSIGAGGPQGTPDAEALLAADPDVIFSLYTLDIAAMDELQQKTGIPVVVLSYGETEVFDEDVLASLTLMGNILGKKERAKELSDYIAAMQMDLAKRTMNIPDAEKKTVYLGCQSNYGNHGIGSSTANYSLFNAVNAKNVLDLHGYTGYQGALDLEAILTMNPDVMILDAGGLSILKEEYKENKAVFDSLMAFRNRKVYVQMPYNAYFTNLEIAYADAYFIGKTLYPNQFDDIDIEEKFGEISTMLLGEDCYEAVAEAMSGGYRKLNVTGLGG